MFVAIEPLLRHCTKLTLSLQMKGDDMVVCVMPQGTAKDAAMLQPLALTATAAELEAGFIDALVAYTGAHASLAEQVAATTAILEAAKTTQVSKATKTLAKGSSKPALPAPGRMSTDADNDDDDASDDAAEGQSTAPTASSASSAADASAEPANTGTNLASLFD
ncbi:MULTISPECIES: PRTRC system protein E [unclassified Caballeronia]|uniref:PRTRC system protein E n=1 Tax=unclassified Caballeronia TaxID=2646786 RepID=UPI002854FA58|nr:MULTISPECIES: PRTRC system protein E [unclassified Caballeronia]MDR5776361.1 PRTRC system protein E [Caballeronia sp. LZ002]MDR5851857.1 PRTRC system protein E [Caballeronia sp. LZ003]